MCHASAGRHASRMNTGCGCDCTCPATLPIEDEIQSLEEHRKILQDQIDTIDKKINALKSVKEP
jgi:hypothetical protein